MLPLCDTANLNNNSSLHLQFKLSRRSEAVRFLVRLSCALNAIVFTGELTDPDMQKKAFEFQQHASMASDR